MIFYDVLKKHVFPQDGHTTWPDVLAFVCYLTHTVSANHYKIKHKKLLPKYFFGGIVETLKSIFSKTKIANYQNDRTSCPPLNELY
jgi:hypothetical protein